MVARGWLWGCVSLAVAAVAVADARHPLVIEPTESQVPMTAFVGAGPKRGDDVGGTFPVVKVRRVPLDHAVSEAAAAKRALFASLAREDPVPPEPELRLDPARLAPRASKLGIPPPPPAPARRTRFAISRADPAHEAARSIARRVALFYNFRAQVPGAVWREDEAARFAIRSQRACLRQLKRLGIRAHLVSRPLDTPVPAPVVIDAPIDGVSFASLHLDREVEISCELAVRFKALARILKEHGVLVVGVNSSYRNQPKVSFHTFGLALDVAAFRMRARTLTVAKHFEVTPDTQTCAATPATPEARALLAIACAIADSGLFSSVLTPNYNEGHRDHFHLDIRPDDPRLFLR
jgi:hypothetical protein